MSTAHHTMPGFGTTALCSIAFLYLPIIAVIIFSFNTGRLITVFEGFGFSAYAEAFQNQDLRRAAVNSLVVALGATVFSTALALMAALAMHRGTVGRKEKQVAYTLIALPLLVPEVVIAVATMAFFSILNIRLGLGNVLVAHTVFCVPFAYAPIRARIGTIPRQMWEAAGDLYATPWQTFKLVTLPLLKPGITSGALLAFITSLDDFIITQMVAPPGAATLPVQIYTMVKRGIKPEINAAASLLLVVSIAIVLMSYLLNRKKES